MGLAVGAVCNRTSAIDRERAVTNRTYKFISITGIPIEPTFLAARLAGRATWLRRERLD